MQQPINLALVSSFFLLLRIVLFFNISTIPTCLLSSATLPSHRLSSFVRSLRTFYFEELARFHSCTCLALKRVYYYDRLSSFCKLPRTDVDDTLTTLSIYTSSPHTTACMLVVFHTSSPHTTACMLVVSTNNRSKLEETALWLLAAKADLLFPERPLVNPAPRSRSDEAAVTPTPTPRTPADGSSARRDGKQPWYARRTTLYYVYMCVCREREEEKKRQGGRGGTHTHTHTYTHTHTLAHTHTHIKFKCLVNLFHLGFLLSIRGCLV